MRFRATIEQSGKTATGIRVPDDVVAGLGAGKRPSVRVTIRGHTYRSTVASMGGAFMVGVSAENRATAGVVGGDEVDVDIELDTAPREVTVPADFAKATQAGCGRQAHLRRVVIEQQAVARLVDRGSEDRRDSRATDREIG
jgi:hypothetical protein